MGWSVNSKKNKGNYQNIQLHQRLMDPMDVMTNRNIRSVLVKWIRIEQRNVYKFESRKIYVAGYQCDNSDFDFCTAEHNELPVIEICSDEGRDDCQQLKPKGTEASFGTTVITAAISRVTVNVLVFVLRVVFLHLIVYICDAVHVRCSASGFCIISKFCVTVF